MRLQALCPKMMLSMKQLQQNKEADDMAVKEKTFNTKIYAVIAFFVVAAILAVATVSTFSSKYTAFKPEKVAQAYVDTIVQKGDGYNAYKYTLLSKNEKFGDFIRQYYMYPMIYKDAGYKPGDNTKKLKGLNDKANKSDKTKNDDGTLAGIVADTMYPYYVELMETYGWDNYDAVFTNYFAKFQEERAKVFGDNYLSDEDMFTALEANVATYGDGLTGTEDTYDSNTKVQLTKKSIGVYEKKYGEDYQFTAATKDAKPVEDLKAYVASMDADKLATYGVTTDDISAAETCTVEVTLADGTVVATQEVNVVQIGNTWYVDNTTTNASGLYNFYK